MNFSEFENLKSEEFKKIGENCLVAKYALEEGGKELFFIGCYDPTDDQEFSNEKGIKYKLFNVFGKGETFELAVLNFLSNVSDNFGKFNKRIDLYYDIIEEAQDKISKNYDLLEIKPAFRLENEGFPSLYVHPKTKKLGMFSL